MDNNQVNNFIPKARLSRRDFLKLLGVSGLGVMVSAAGYSILAQNEADWLDVSHVRLVLPRLPGKFSGVRIVQVSDFHLGSWMNGKRLQQVFDVLKELKPDVVTITGDIVLGSRHESTLPQQLDEMEVALKDLSRSCPVLSVMGNHEYWYNTSSVTRMLRRGRVQSLVNDVVSVHAGTEELYFAGIDDLIAGQPNLDELLSKLPAEGCVILLSHEPDFADKSAATGRFDLQISGHSHGGQVNLPLIGPPVLPELGRKYPSGLYRVGSMYQYTNRGVGMTPPNVRINCPAEITVFTLESPRSGT
jgi:hypothetical protein